MSRARPLAPIFSRATPHFCLHICVAFLLHEVLDTIVPSNWGVPTLGATTTMDPATRTEALCVPKPDLVFWNCHCLPAHFVSHAEAEKGPPFPLGLCFATWESEWGLPHHTEFHGDFIGIIFPCSTFFFYSLFVLLLLLCRVQLQSSEIQGLRNRWKQELNKLQLPLRLRPLLTVLATSLYAHSLIINCVLLPENSWVICIPRPLWPWLIGLPVRCVWILEWTLSRFTMRFFSPLIYERTLALLIFSIFTSHNPFYLHTALQVIGIFTPITSLVSL